MIMSSSTASFFTLWNNDNVLDTMLASDYKDPPRVFTKDESMENEIKCIDDQGGERISEMKECISPTLRREMKHHEPLVFENSKTISIDMGGGKSSVSISTEQSPTLCTTHYGEPAVATFETHAQDMRFKKTEVSQTIGANAGMGGGNLPFALRSKIRRITPIEAERLMGFPDNWTQIPWRGKPAEECPDSHRYKACGNSMCVNVMRWIGMRIEDVERRTQCNK